MHTQRSALQNWLRQRWAAFGVAVLGTALAIAVRLLFDSYFEMRAPGLPFLFGVLTAGWMGGLYPALFAVALSIVALETLAPSPWAVGGSTAGLLLAVYIAAGVFISVLCEHSYRQRHETRRQRALLDEALDAICAWRPDGTLLMWTGGAERLYGYDSKHALGRRVHELLATRLPQPLDAILATLRTQRTWHGELEQRTRDGRTLTVETRLALAEDGDETDIVIESSRDLTDGKRTEANLELVLSTIGDNLVVYDREWRYRYVNNAAAALLGRSRDELLGRRVWDIFPDAREASFLREAQRAVAQQCAVRTEHFFEPRGRWFENHIYPSSEGVTVFSSDITARKELEAELREIQRRKDEFIAVLAHELRGPLAPLRNGVEILRTMAAAPVPVRDTAQMMERQVRSLVRLIDDLLDISRISRGKLTLQLTPLSITDALTAAVEAARPVIASRDLELTLQLCEPAPTVNADRARLEQVFGNLLSNAAKYTDRGGQIVVRSMIEGNRAVVEVSDSGIGIPPESLASVFEMFWQVDAHKDRVSGGLGIGLALVRYLVELHGGKVSVQSAGENCGSTFTVQLPLAEYVERAASQANVSHLNGTRARRVLVVDDNPDTVDSLAALLRLAGHVVKVASNGYEAIEHARDFQPEIVLMDLGMPELDGYAAARRIRSESWGQPMRLVAMTGWGQESDRRKSRGAGFDTHLVKPVEAQALNEILNS